MDLTTMIEAAVKSGALGLAFTLAALGYQTRALQRMTARDTRCQGELLRLRLAVVRLYSAVRRLRNEPDDPLPALDELMRDRRGGDDPA